MQRIMRDKSQKNIQSSVDEKASRETPGTIIRGEFYSNTCACMARREEGRDGIYCCGGEEDMGPKGGENLEPQSLFLPRTRPTGEGSIFLGQRERRG